MRAIILICLTAFCFYSATAQTPVTAVKDKTLTAEVVPPAEVKDKFIKEHPSVTPSWSMDGKNFKAEFVDPNTFKGNCIVYDAEGNVIRRENEMENASYPKSINDYFIKTYPGEKFKTWSSLDARGNRTFYIKRNNDQVWFDKDGKVIESKK